MTIRLGKYGCRGSRSRRYGCVVVAVAYSGVAAQEPAGEVQVVAESGEAGAPQAGEVERLLRDAAQAALGGRHGAALTALTQVLERAPEDFRARMAAAVVLLDMGELQRSHEVASQALVLAAEEHKSVVETLLAEVQLRARFRGQVARGDAALAANRYASAARAFTSAWMLRPDQGRVALRAARAWTVIEEFGAALSLLVPLRDSGDQELAGAAERLWASIEPIATSRYRGHLVAARRLVEHGHPESAVSELQAATRFRPDLPEPFEERAALASRSGDLDAAERCVGMAVERGCADRAKLIVRSDLHALHERGAYRALMQEVFGPDVFEAVAGDVALARAQSLAVPERRRELERLVATGVGGIEAFTALTAAARDAESRRVATRWAALCRMRPYLDRFGMRWPELREEQAARFAGSAELDVAATASERVPGEFEAWVERWRQANERRRYDLMERLVAVTAGAGVEESAVVLELLAGAGADPQLRNPALLIMACQAANAPALRVLLGLGLPADAVDTSNYYKNQYRPLAVAVTAQAVECVRLLVEAGADPDAIVTFGPDGEQTTARRLAAGLTGPGADGIRAALLR